MALVLVFAASVSAQPHPGRPMNYSHLVGRYKIAAEITPNEIIVEDPLTLRVVITGDGNDAPSRSQLRIFPDDLAESFYVEPVPSADVASPEKKRWEFVWKLRPKSTEVREVPSLALVSYSPQSRRYQTDRSDALAIVVKPRTNLDDVEPPLPDDLPESFFTLAERSPARAETASPWLWLVAATFVAVVCWALTRPIRTNVGEGRFSITALDGRNPIEFVGEYFRRRLGGPAGELTAGDADVLLKRAGASRELRAAWKSWWRDADACRFAPESADRSLAIGAIEHVRRTEAELRRSVRHLANVVVLLALTATLSASPPSNWNAASEAFRKGIADRRAGQPFRADFARAADAFARADDAGTNLGNARFLAGQLPEAIIAFRAHPSDPTARRHLEYARRQVALPPELVRPALPWYWIVPETGLHATIAVGLFVGAVLLPIGLRRRSTRLAFAGGIAATIGLATCGIAEWRRAAIADERLVPIAVLRDDAPLRVGNSDRYEPHPTAPTLPRGYEVRILDKRGDWLRVECPGGQTGWIRSPAAAQQPGC